MILEKLVQILVFGCAYRRIAEVGCSATAIRDRRDEWIELGMMEHLRRIALSSYDRFIGIELGDVAVDGCITKAPCGGEKASKNPVVDLPRRDGSSENLMNRLQPSPSNKVGSQAAEAYITRCLNRSKFPRPYIERLMSLSLLT